MANEFNSRNATLSINQQTISQRAKNENRFRVNGKILGVGSDNSSALFAGADGNGSPIGYNDSDGEDGLSNRNFGENIDGENINDVYSLYAKTIDNGDGVTGFGFSGSEPAFMNYNHSNNPFIKDENVDYNALTSGTPMQGVKAYKGFPDLVAGDIDNPAQEQEVSPTSDLDQLADGSTYARTTTEYREQIGQTASMLGRHVKIAEEGNGKADTLGKYFTKRIEEIGE